MMNTNLFKLAQKIEITAEDATNDKLYSYSSRIEDFWRRVTGDCRALQARGFYLPPARGRRYKACVVTEAGLYNFQIKLLDQINDQVPLWVVSVVSEIVKIQRRAYVRLNIKLPAQFRFVTREGGSDYSNTILTNNISGGGVQLLSDTYMPVGAKLKLVLPLNDLTVETEGIVVHSIPPGDFNRNYKIGCAICQD